MLDRGQSVHTNRTRLVMEYGGDLAIYDETNRLRWSSGTAGRGYRAVFQSDGNLVVYDQNWTGLWTSGTAGHNGAVLVLDARREHRLRDVHAVIDDVRDDLEDRRDDRRPAG